MNAFSRTSSLNVTLSVVVPCYNEEHMLKESITRLHHTLAKECALEIILVDDASTDASYKVAQELAAQFPQIKLFKHPQNRGKGAALRTGFSKTTGEIIAIHDADLEYSPTDLKRMLYFMVENKADVMFGTRFRPREAARVLYFWHSIANRIITLWSNMWSDLNLTDIECCYKMFTRRVLSGITITEDRFGVEPELVARCAHMKLGGAKLKIFEMGIDYHGRTYEEGKKIGMKDGFRALWAIAKYNYMARRA
jgi:dolichol-phosphate mannosyltransferase